MGLASSTKMGTADPLLRLGGIGDEESGWLFLVLEYCDAPTRSACIFLSKRYCSTLTSQMAFKWRLERLHVENGIYFPSKLPPNETWKTLYEELFLRRNLWVARDEVCHDYSIDSSDRVEEEDSLPPWRTKKEHTTDENYNIAVCARFKPLKDSVADHVAEKTTLPLHQRLALIRISNVVTSNRDALAILKGQGGWFHERWASLERKRPHEGSQGKIEDEVPRENRTETLEVSCGVKTIDPDKSRIVIVDPTKGLREFEFDHVLGGDSSQELVYDSSARRLVCDFINGYNATCLVYGMTGSGKTFTMFGPTEKDAYYWDTGYSGHLRGIVPRACSEVFEAIACRNQNLNIRVDASVSISYVEIYGNEINDLLKKGQLCGNSKTSAQHYVLSGAADVPVNTVADVMRFLKIGEDQKRKASTAMNERSSRAHSIFIVTLNQKCKDTNVSVTSKLFLADLGGCEQTKKSQVEAGKSQHIEHLKKKMMQKTPALDSDADNDEDDDDSNETDLSRDESTKEKEYSTGFVKSDRMREAVYINLGLMSLKACVEALNSGKPSAHVPYSNSKLTMLLSSGLGGNCKTSVVVCAAQDKEHIAETISAMKFGQSCRKITTKARTGITMLEDLIERLDSEIFECEERIRQKERWEVREEKRLDLLAEEGSLESRGFGGVEVRKTTVLVGAEEDRKRLIELLRKKAELTGISVESQIGGERFGGRIGFGDAHRYGLGAQYIVTAEEKENYRFRSKPSESDIPVAVKERGGTTGWKTGDEILEDSDSLAKRAKTIRRSKLVYSGISA